MPHSMQYRVVMEWDINSHAAFGKLPDRPGISIAAVYLPLSLTVCLVSNRAIFWYVFWYAGGFVDLGNVPW